MNSESPLVLVVRTVNDTISGWYGSLTSFFTDNIGEIIFVLSCCLGVVLAFVLARQIQQIINIIAGRESDS